MKNFLPERFSLSEQFFRTVSKTVSAAPLPFFVNNVNKNCDGLLVIQEK